MNANLLDLTDDILEIIGGYVKKDNLDRILKEKLKQNILEYFDKKIKIERKKQEKENTM